jgi:phage gp29-like protein
MLHRLGNWLTGPIRNRRTVIASAAGDGHLANPADVLGNPLRNLTPANAATLLQDAMRGQWTRAQWLMYYVEQWDADVWTLVERRCAGLRQLDWTIRIDAQAERQGLAALAEEQRQLLHECYASIGNMREAVEFLALAKFRGYSHLAIANGRLEPVDQWWWVRDGMYGPWYYNPEAKLTTAAALGEPVSPGDFVIREEPRSLIWLSVLKFLRASHNAKWWDRFCEISSRQGTVIIGPPDLTDEQAAQFESRAIAIARGSSGVLENGSRVERPSADGVQGGGKTAWESRLRYLKEDLILAGTGGLLTALSQATGIGGSQGKEQGDVWRTLLRADAQSISEVLQQQFDTPRLHDVFPNQPILAWFELDTSETPSADRVLEHAVTARQAGFLVSQQQLSERTGYELAPAPELLPPPTGTAGEGGTAASQGGVAAPGCPG